MKKLAIIGASYLQEPLIRKANERGIETHVFAWAANDVGEKIADHFYPISIVEKDQILEKCREIQIDGICSIASDLAMLTVNYVANRMGLTANSDVCTELSTNKHLMRECFERNGDPSPLSIMVSSVKDLDEKKLNYPLIVKPLDRSGSRGISKVTEYSGLEAAIEAAKEVGFDKHALVEEFATGKEYSVEFISWQGQHHFLAVTKKFTTGAPNFIETGHLEPAPLEQEMVSRIISVVSHALTSLGIQYGASHSEIKISESGDIKIIEIGGRMGGDCIGSSLVQLSTGFDFVNGVIDVALGRCPDVITARKSYAAVRFVFNKDDLKCLENIKKDHPEILVESNVRPISDEHVNDSSGRFGYYLLSSDRLEVLEEYLPEEGVE